MKTLKDPGQVLEIMSRKLDKRYVEADGKEATEIGGQEESMKNKRMIIALKPRSMGELAGWDLFLSEYLQQGLSGGGDFQITMDYKEGDGLTMQLVKGDKKLKETHIRREPLDIAAKVLHHAARFTLVAQRRNENPSILLAQDTGVWVSKDSIEVEAVSLDTQPAD